MTETASTTSESVTSTPSTSTPETSPDASVPTSAEILAKRVSKRENARDKAKRLLIYGRLRVTKVDGDLVVAECRGDSGEIYNLGFDPRVRQWRCTCAAIGPCSHLHALWAVAAVNGAV